MTAPNVMNFLFTTWEGGGSVPPVLTVARKLIARGHRVRVMSDACNRPECEAVGAVFTPWTSAPSRASRSRDTDFLADWQAETPQAGLMRAIDAVWAGPALAYARDVMAELEREAADLVVTSEMLFGVAAGCEAAHQPYALLCVNVSLFPIPGIPPMGPGLAPARSDGERALHAEITQGGIALFDHGLPALNAARAKLGLAPLDHLIDQTRTAEACLLAISRAFDFAPEELPQGVRYVGPQIGEPAWAEPWQSPWPTDDPRPLIAVGFSTTFQDHAAVLQRIADAVSGLPVRAVITLGEAILPGEITAPKNVQVVGSCSHDALMREAAVVVTHGGHGTVARALRHRRPLLVMPHGRDQNDNAVRVTERGAGLSLPPTATVAQIRGALGRLLSEPGFGRAADRLGAQVANDVETSPVVEDLEALAAGARPGPGERPAKVFCPA